MKRARDRCRHIVIARSLRCVAFVITCALAGCVSPYKQGAGKFDTVIIDAGHGGHDRGGRAVSGSPEKVLALDTARRLAAILRTKGFRVIETRTRDVFVPLGSRVASCNSTGSSIFVSIHYNWAPRRGPGELKSITRALDRGVLPRISCGRLLAPTPPTTVASSGATSTSYGRTAGLQCSVSWPFSPTRWTTATLRTPNTASGWPNLLQPVSSRNVKGRNVSRGFAV